MVAAPPASTILQANSTEISSITICNVTGSSATISIQISGTPIRIIKVILPSDSTAEYEDGNGWQFFDINGNRIVVITFSVISGGLSNTTYTNNVISI